MTKKKERGFVFLPSFAAFIELLPEEQQLEAFWAISKYGLYGEKPRKGSASSAFLELIIPVIDASQNRYKASVENGKKGAEYGKLGGRPKKKEEKPQKKPQRKPQDIDKELDIEKEVEKEKEMEKESVSRAKKPTRTNFTPPSLEDVMGYCVEKEYMMDAERFIDYYTSNGWMVGRNKMKDWKAAVRNWVRKDKPPKQEATSERVVVPKSWDEMTMDDW